MTVATLPLEDVRVLDLTVNVAGPTATQLLGDLGADVLKIERPEGGDDTRGWYPPRTPDGESVTFRAFNRNKRSRRYDLGNAEDRDAVLRLAREADVVVESFRPGVADRLGIGYDDCRVGREDLVYCSIVAHADGTERRAEPGYDPLMQATAGIMAVTGTPDGDRVRVGASLVDQGAGMWAALSILAALRNRDRHGRGARLEIALYDVAVSWLPYQLGGYLATGREPQRLGTGVAMVVPYRVYDTKDGELLLAAGNQRLWSSLCTALERPDLAADARFATNALRVEHRAHLDALLGAQLRTRPTAEWTARLTSAGVPNGAVRPIAAVARDAETRRLLINGAGPPLVGSPLPWRGRGLAPPALGEHDETPDWTRAS